MNRVQRLAALVAELRARKIAEASVPLAVAELEAAGFRVHPFPDGLAVDRAPGLDERLAALEARGIKPTVFIIRRFEDEPDQGRGPWGSGS